MIASGRSAAAWHDVECASYAADLPVWRELADRAAGEVLDIGCGTGRVALDLAARGHRVTGVDSDPELIRALSARADGAVRGVVADARSLELERAFALAVAPMQVIQLMGGAEGRAALLASVRRHLEPGAVLALAIADPYEELPPESALPPLPDVREEDGWVLSSTPVSVSQAEHGLDIVRHRQAVSPRGELSEEVVTLRLDALDAETLAEEARVAGFTAAGMRRVPETRDHVGTTVVLLEAAP